jgi:prevent-host-death family protein
MIARKTKSVGAYEAKTHLPALLKQVERGREIIITRRERPIARLVPVHTVSGEMDIFDRLLAFHGRIKLPKGETGKDLIEAGRRM